MIPEKIRYNVSAYNNVNNMRNIAYLAGAVLNSRIDKQRQEWTFEIQQTNNSKLALPVSVRGAEALNVAKGFADMDGISLKGHVIGRLNKYNRAVAHFNVLTVERPNLMEMPSYSAWHRPGPKAMTVDSTEPLFYGTAQRASNKVALAGIVHTAFLEDKDCLVLTLRQHKDPALAIPVRIYGRFAKEYSKRIKQSMPIVIEGMYRCRVIQLDPENDEAVAREPYVHAGHVRTPLREDISRMPDWWNPEEFSQAPAISTEMEEQIQAQQAAKAEREAAAEAKKAAAEAKKTAAAEEKAAKSQAAPAADEKTATTAEPAADVSDVKESVEQVTEQEEATDAKKASEGTKAKPKKASTKAKKEDEAVTKTTKTASEEGVSDKEDDEFSIL